MSELPKLYTAKEVAALTGRQPNTISKLAKRHQIGQLIGSGTGGSYVFTAEDIERIRAIPVQGGKQRADGTPAQPDKTFDPAAIKRRGRWGKRRPDPA